MYIHYKETVLVPNSEEKIIKESKTYYKNHEDLKAINEIAATYQTKVFWVSLSGVN